MDELRRRALEACVKYHSEDLCRDFVETADKAALIACILDPYYCCAVPCELVGDYLAELEEAW